MATNNEKPPLASYAMNTIVRSSSTGTEVSTAAAKPAKPMRLNQKAVLIPEAQFAQWHEIGLARPGLSELDRQILDVIAPIPPNARATI